MRRSSDPFTILSQGMRRMSTLTLDDITKGIENFANPSARGLLESLGRTRDEQVASITEMLRNSSEEDIAEIGQIFGQAMAKLAEERANAHGDDTPERPRRRRDQTAAEWRRQRHLAS